MKKNYPLRDIKVLPGNLHIRKRPAMYLGSVDEQGLQALFTMTLDGAISEAKTRVSVSFGEGGSFCVSHDGAGIPVKKHAKMDKSILELVMTTMGCGGTDNSEKVMLAALCKKLVVETTDDEPGWPHRYSMQFAQGVVTSPLSEGVPTALKGTQITFWPDPQIFRDSVMSVDWAREEMAAIQLGHPDIKIEEIAWA